MTITRTTFSIIKLAIVFAFVSVTFAVQAQELTPQERFNQIQADTLERKETFEATQQEKKADFEAKRLEFQAQTAEKKEEFRKEVGERKEEFEDLSEERQAQLREKVEARKTEVKEKRDERKAVLEVRQQERIANLAANVSNRMEAAIARIRQIIERFQTRMDTLKDRGVDIAAANITLDEASSHLDAAQALISGIDVLIADVIASESPREAWTTAKAQYTEIKNHIKLAHISLRTSLQLLKDAIEQAKNPEPTEKPSSEEIIDSAAQEAPIN